MSLGTKPEARGGRVSPIQPRIKYLYKRMMALGLIALEVSRAYLPVYYMLWKVKKNCDLSSDKAAWHLDLTSGN